MTMKKIEKMMSATKTMLCTASLLVALGLPAAARADNSVSMRVNNTWVAHSGFDLVSDDDHMAQMEFNYARRLYPLWDGGLWAEASYMLGAQQDKLFGGQLETDVLFQAITVGARFTYPIFSWLVPFTRAALGVGIGSLSLEGAMVGGDAVHDTTAAFCGHLLVGVEVLLPLRRFRETGRGFTIGLVIEGGIGFSSGLGFDIAPEEDDELLQIPLEGSGLGRINPSGGQLRVGVVARF